MTIIVISFVSKLLFPQRFQYIFCQFCSPEMGIFFMFSELFIIFSKNNIEIRNQIISSTTIVSVYDMKYDISFHLIPNFF